MKSSLSLARSFLTFVLPAMLLASGPTLDAQTLGWQGFDQDQPNFLGASQLNVGVDAGSILGGIQFHTGNDTTYLTSISFANLVTTDSTLPATVRFSLYEGGATVGQFGNIIADLGTLITTADDVSSPLPSTILQQLPSDTQILLQPDTTYWIGMTNVTGGMIYTRWGADDSTFIRLDEIQSELGWTALDAWGAMPFSDPDDPMTEVPFAMNVYASIVPIPEPSGFILCGLAGIFWIASRKRK